MKSRVPTLDEFMKVNEGREHFLLQEILKMTNDKNIDTTYDHTKLLKEIHDLIRATFPSLKSE